MRGRSSRNRAASALLPVSLFAAACSIGVVPTSGGRAVSTSPRAPATTPSYTTISALTADSTFVVIATLENEVPNSLRDPPIRFEFNSRSPTARSELHLGSRHLRLSL